jgi:hypothetical protein
MERRDALKLLASATILPALSTDVFSLFQAVHVQTAESPGLKTLNPHQGLTVTTIAEMIIPQTETPGAKAARVNEFIDVMLTEWYEDTAHFLAGLANVDTRSRDLFGKSFIECAEKQQVNLLQALEEEGLALRKKNAQWGTEGEGLVVSATDFFQTIKRLTLIGYYTSQVGFEQELHQSIIPPKHDECAPLDAEAAK